MKRLDIEAIKTAADDVPDFSIYTEEDGLSIKCETWHREEIKDHINNADARIFTLCEYVKELERKLARISVALNEPE